jgi:hypothetical protein
MKPSTAALLATLLWSSTDDNDQPLDSGIHEPSPELIARLEADWERFQDAIQDRMPDFDPDEHCLTGDLGQMEHDFILTRNRHGCGFWEESDWEAPYGDQLTAICHEMGEIEPYVMENGKIGVAN